MHTLCVILYLSFAKSDKTYNDKYSIMHTNQDSLHALLLPLYETSIHLAPGITRRTLLHGI